MNKRFFTIFVLIFTLCLISGCRACRKEAEPEVSVASEQVVLKMRGEGSLATEVETPNVRRIEIGSSKRIEEKASTQTFVEQPEETASKGTTDAALPPDTHEETALTARLREKMLDAYAGREEALPDVKIYLSEMKYDEFVKYYENLGYKVTTVAVPASEVIQPVLEQRPELAQKLNLSKYENVVIHQVMINDAGISAADKYIDPDTFEVIDKTFVTKMNK